MAPAVVLQSHADHRLRQHGCGRRAVAGIVVGLRSDLLDHLGAHVGNRVLQLHLLGDGHTVLGHLGSTELLVDDYVASFGTERYLHSVRQSVHALLEKLTGFHVVFYLFCHNRNFFNPTELIK